MVETKFHERIKKRFARKRGKIERKLKYGGRGDASTQRKELEFNRSGTIASLTKDIRKLKRSRKPHRILRVLKKSYTLEAIKIARELHTNVTIKYGRTYRKP